MQSQCVSSALAPGINEPSSNATVESTAPWSIGFRPNSPSTASSQVPARSNPFFPVAQELMPSPSGERPPIRK